MSGAGGPSGWPPRGLGGQATRGVPSQSGPFERPYGAERGGRSRAFQPASCGRGSHLAKIRIGMAQLAEVWRGALPKILQGVTGRGVWTALNGAVPITLEEGVFVLGVPPQDNALGAHLRLPSTSQLIERNVSQGLGSQIRLRVIDGTTTEDWELVKRRDVERRRLQEAELTKMKAELQAKTSWEGVYEQLSRRFASVSNRSLPQNRARFLEEAIAI